MGKFHILFLLQMGITLICCFSFFGNEKWNEKTAINTSVFMYFHENRNWKMKMLLHICYFAYTREPNRTDTIRYV